MLKHPTTGELIRQNSGKSKILFEIFFPIPTHANDDIGEHEYPPPAFKFKEIMNEDIGNAIAKLKPYKAPDPNGLQNVVIKEHAEILILYLV